MGESTAAVATLDDVGIFADRCGGVSRGKRNLQAVRQIPALRCEESLLEVALDEVQAASRIDGLLASAFPLLRLGGNASAAKDPAKLKLLTQKEELEQQIDRLKYQKAAMPIEEYKKQLGALLLQLAKTQAELDK